MTSFETASIVVAAIALVISTFSVMSAVAAKRAALAAEKQASHAETQADAALVQAQAAEHQVRAAQQQVALMQQTQLLDTIGTAFRVRRETITAVLALTNYNDAAQRRDSSAEVNSKWDIFSKHLATLEDAPPVFPRNVRALLFGAIQMVNEAQRPYRRQQFDIINRQFGQAEAAMNVYITKRINELWD